MKELLQHPDTLPEPKMVRVIYLLHNSVTLREDMFGAATGPTVEPDGDHLAYHVTHDRSGAYIEDMVIYGSFDAGTGKKSLLPAIPLSMAMQEIGTE